MKIKAAGKSFLTLESVAMTDIVMNLFIFFFISFSLLYTFNTRRESKIEVKLPRGSPRESAQKETPLVITVTSGNEIYMGKTRMRPEEVGKVLSARADREKVSGLLVRSDKSASVDTLVRVLDAAKEAGIGKLGVAVEER